MWRPAGEPFQQIGLGWFLWKCGAEPVAGHNGSDTGFVADMELLPERKIGVIVLCNLDHGPSRALMLAALSACSEIKGGARAGNARHSACRA